MLEYSSATDSAKRSMSWVMACVHGPEYKITQPPHRQAWLEGKHGVIACTP